MIPNTFGVAGPIWSGWSNRARGVYNDLYGRMTKFPEEFQHYQQAHPVDEHWEFTAQAVAFVAAESTDNGPI